MVGAPCKHAKGIVHKTVLVVRIPWPKRSLQIDSSPFPQTNASVEMPQYPCTCMAFPERDGKPQLSWVTVAATNPPPNLRGVHVWGWLHICSCVWKTKQYPRLRMRLVLNRKNQPCMTPRHSVGGREFAAVHFRGAGRKTFDHGGDRGGVKFKPLVKVMFPAQMLALFLIPFRAVPCTACAPGLSRQPLDTYNRSLRRAVIKRGLRRAVEKTIFETHTFRILGSQLQHLGDEWMSEEGPTKSSGAIFPHFPRRFSGSSSCRT